MLKEIPTVIEVDYGNLPGVNASEKILNTMAYAQVENTPVRIWRKSPSGRDEIVIFAQPNPPSTTSQGKAIDIFDAAYLTPQFYPSSQILQ